MVPILYTSEKEYIGELKDCSQVLVTEERNGMFEIEIDYHLTSDFSDRLVRGNIIEADANDELKGQLFRIYKVTKNIFGNFVVYGRHISYDIARDRTEGLEIENQSCEYCLKMLFKESYFSEKFNGYSDIVNAQDFKINATNLLTAIVGERGSIIDTFGTGAEILRDNYDFYVLNKRGTDNDVTVEYASNMTGLEYEENEDGLITCIRAIAKFQDGDGNEQTVSTYVDSDKINNYETPFISEIDFSDKFEEGTIPTVEKLEILAQNYFTNNACDVMKFNYKIEFIPLSKCAGYEGIEDKISLCDTVRIIDYRYNLDTKAKVIKVTYNVLKERYESMELGEPRSSLGDIVNTESNKGEKGDKGDKGDKGEDGSISIEDFPDTLPDVPEVSTTVYGFANIEITWSYENEIYYQYEVYADKEENFTPNIFNLIHQGQTSTFMYQAQPNETWFFKVCALNTYGNRTEFGSASATTVKIDDLSNYVEELAIKDALIDELNLGRGWVGELKGNYIDAKQLSVTDGNGKRTLDIDSFGNVSLDVSSLKISSYNVATEDYAKTQANNAISSANSSTDNKLKNYYTSTETSAMITALNDSISLKATKTEITEQIDNLELGGTNYLLYTNFDKDSNLSKWETWYQCTLDTTTYGGGAGSDIDAHITNQTILRGSTDIATQIEKGYNYGGFAPQYALVEKNTTYTFSCWLYISKNTSKAEVRVYHVIDDVVSSSNRLATITRTEYLGSFEKITITFTTSNVSNEISIRFYNYYDSELTEGTSRIYVYQPMLAKGDKAKDWTESTEELEESIDILKERVSSAELKIEPDAIISTVTTSEDWTSLTGRVSTAEQKITSDAIISTVTTSKNWTTQTTNISNAQNTADEAKKISDENVADISSLMTRVSTAEQKITSDAIISTVSSVYATKEEMDSLELGGGNYLLYTNFDKDSNLSKWETWYQCTLDTTTYGGGAGSDIDAHITNQTILRGSTDIATQIEKGYNYGGFAPQYALVEKNTTYTFSCWLYISKNTSKAEVRVYHVIDDVVSSSNRLATITRTEYLGSFEKITITFTTSNISNEISIRFYNYYDSELIEGTSSIYIYQPMLAKGDKVKDWTESTEELSAELIEAQSEITQLANEITLKVSEGDLSSIIRQSADDIQIGFNGINDRIEINSQYMKFEAENGNKDMLLYGGQICIYNNTDDSFMSTLGSVLKESDTSYKGIGFLAGENCNTFFIGRDSSWGDILTDRSPDPKGIFYINFTDDIDGYKGVNIRDNLYTTGNIQAINNTQPTITGFGDIACTNSIFDNWKSVVDQSVIIRYDGGDTNIYLGKNLNGNGYTASNFSSITATTYTLATSSNFRLGRDTLYNPKYGSSTRDYVRLVGTYIAGGQGAIYLTDSETADWANFYAGTIYSNQTSLTSDKNLKTDIKYVNVDTQTISEESGLIAPNVNITTEDMHEFIETLPMVSYRMKSDVKKGIDDTYYGFLAQEILYTKVGSELIKIEQITNEEGENVESYRYSENKFVSFIAGALQEEIQKRKELEVTVQNLIQIINS